MGVFRAGLSAIVGRSPEMDIIEALTTRIMSKGILRVRYRLFAVIWCCLRSRFNRSVSREINEACMENSL